MDEKVPELLDLTKKLLDLSKDIFEESLTPHESLERINALYSVFLRVQMQEALRFGYGAYYSCYHGWGHGGIGASRSIYEILLDIKYINQDETLKEERFTRFLDHGDEYLYHKMRIILESGQTVSEKDQDKYTNAYNQLKKKYNDKHKQEVDSYIEKANATPKHRPYNWAGIDLSEKVKMVNLEQFHQLYKNLSNLSHVSIGATLAAIADSTENQIEVDLSLYPSPVHCFLVLKVMFTCISGILEEYMTYFKIEYSDHPILENLWKNYQKLLNE